MSSLKNAFGFKPYLELLYKGVVQSVTSLVMFMVHRNRAAVTSFVHWNRVVSLLVSFIESEEVSFGRLPRCGGACKFQIKIKSKKYNVRSQFTSIR